MHEIEVEGALPNSFYDASITHIPNRTKTHPKRRTTGQSPYWTFLRNWVQEACLTCKEHHVALQYLLATVITINTSTLWKVPCFLTQFKRHLLISEPIFSRHISDVPLSFYCLLTSTLIWYFWVFTVKIHWMRKSELHGKSLNSFITF
jgi:hypothetical protein